MSNRNPLVRLRYFSSARFRRERFAFFWNTVGKNVTDGWWLDLGGGPGSYFLPQFPDQRRVILLEVNADELHQALANFPNARGIVADGQHLPFANESIACVFCNSVIEHVSHPDQLAAEIERVGQKFFVQTPNGDFPIETHSAIPIPFYKFLPHRLRPLICRLLGAQFDYVASVTYVAEEKLRRFFPNGELRRERVWGMTKAYYVIRR